MSRTDRLRGPAPPATPRKPLFESRHGIDVADPWRWLEDAEQPAVRGWLAAQRHHARAVLDALPGRDAAVARLTPRILAEAAGAPIPWNGMLLVLRRRPGEEQACLFLRERAGGQDVLLVDPTGIDPDGHVSIEVEAVGERLVAVAVRHGGVDETETWFLDPASRRWDSWRLPAARRDDLHLLAGDRAAAWTERSEGTTRLVMAARGAGPSERADRIECVLGQSAASQASIEGGWLLRRDEGAWFARRLAPPFEEIPLALPEHAYAPQVIDGGVIARLSYVGYGDELVLARGEPGQLTTWQRLVSARQWPIGDVFSHAGHVVVEFVEEGSRVLRIFTLDGAMRHVVRIPGWGDLSLAGFLDDPPSILLHASSWDLPPELLSLDLGTGALAREWRSEQPPLRRAVVTRKLVLSSRDGVRVPAWIAHARDARPDGMRPALLLGYGGFGVIMAPTFHVLVAEWLDLGGIVMLPALRGGGEMGHRWGDQARGAGKHRTFDDFIAAAEWLVAEGWSRPERIAVRGGSNGGLTCGALITQRPDLVAAAVLSVPLLDMTRHDVGTHGAWISEYGDPEDPEAYRALLRYSPLQRIQEATPYPGVLLVTGGDDTRVPPWHARKMAAALQSASSSGRPVLLHDEPRQGHSGTPPATASLRRTADELAFLAWQLDIPLR